jgi:hypothetical protein
MKPKYELMIGLLSACITTPIWYFLLYQILKRVNASELMFFLFWVYVPVHILALIITNIFKGK